MEMDSWFGPPEKTLFPDVLREAAQVVLLIVPKSSVGPGSEVLFPQVAVPQLSVGPVFSRTKNYYGAETCCLLASCVARAYLMY